MEDIYNPFSRLLELEIETEKPIDTYEHENEDSARNRMFIWQFTPDDIKNFVGIFETYNTRPDTDVAREALSTALHKRCMQMLNARCLPIECMLYASKVSNARMNENLINVLAVRIKDIYRSPGRGDITVEALEHIINNWIWVPQVRAAIVAVGLIRDRDELFDCIMPLVNGEALKQSIFSALMQKKNKANLDRALGIISTLEATNDIDRNISAMFQAECNGFTTLGIDYLKTRLNDYLHDSTVYLNNLGRSTLRNVANIWNVTPAGREIDELARRSRDDDQAYHEFLDMCRERNDEEVTFRCRFSRRDIIDDFLIQLIQSDDASVQSKANSFIAIAQLSCSRRPNARRVDSAKDLLRRYKNQRDHEFACLTSLMLLCDRDAIQEFVSLMRQKTPRELHNLYSLLNTASLMRSRDAVPLISAAVSRELADIFDNGWSYEMYNFASNLREFRRRNVDQLISIDCLRLIKSILLKYAADTSLLDADAVNALIDVAVMFRLDGVTDVLFKLYDQHSNADVRAHARKKLIGLGIEDPAINH